VTTSIGIIGCGRAAMSLHLPALARVATARVAALADLDAARLAAAVRACPEAAAYSEAGELLDHPGLEAVLVATPPRWHRPLAEEAMARGLHVLVEKPVAGSPGEAAALVGAVAARDVRAAVGHNLRCHQLVREARDRLGAGAIGGLVAVRTIWTSDLAIVGDLPAWSERPTELGGVAHEIGVHHFDLLRFLLGREIERVHVASGAGDAAASINGLLAGGVPFNMVLSRSTASQHQVDVLGTDGSLALDCYRFDGVAIAPVGAIAASPGARLRRLAETARRLPEGVRAMRRGGHYIDSFRLEWESFLAAVRDGGPVHCTLEDGLRAVEVAHACALSVLEGRVVEVAETAATAGRRG
jgi:predicted dehydrogenase